MLKASAHILVLLIWCTTGTDQVENNPPVVKLISPETNTTHAWDSQVRYRVHVSDKEDGDSKYEEITQGEVLLEVRYVKDTTQIQRETFSANRKPMKAMMLSNCLNCHAFNSKLIGPSFTEIKERYPSSTSNIDLLTRRVREGSVGVWGSNVMPTHHELSEEETNTIVKWILDNSGSDEIHYHTGTEGTFRISKPADHSSKGAFLVTASYTDHGAKEDNTDNLTGEASIFIFGK